MAPRAKRAKNKQSKPNPVQGPAIETPSQDRKRKTDGDPKGGPQKKMKAAPSSVSARAGSEETVKGQGKPPTNEQENMQAGRLGLGEMNDDNMEAQAAPLSDHRDDMDVDGPESLRDDLNDTSTSQLQPHSDPNLGLDHSGLPQPSALPLASSRADEEEQDFDEEEQDSDEEELDLDEEELDLDEEQPDFDEEQLDFDEDEPNGDAQYGDEPYYTSALTGDMWVQSLKYGKPHRIRENLGVSIHTFRRLRKVLAERCGDTDSRHVTLDEQLAIFLYTCVTGVLLKHVAERFQHPTATIAKYFALTLFAFSSPPFYSHYVRLPQADDPIPERIHQDPKLCPYFHGAIGAMGGTHIECAPSAKERELMRRFRGHILQNCLAACSFDLRILYIHSSWAAADKTMFHDTRVTDLSVPPGKYYLADAGFPACDSLMVPFQGVRYRLTKQVYAEARPSNAQELYNLRHASARNVVEHVFAMLKARFKILVVSPQFNLDLQGRLPAALAAVHNFILQHDPDDARDVSKEVDGDLLPGMELEELAVGPLLAAQSASAKERQNHIALQMWEEYQATQRLHGQ